MRVAFFGGSFDPPHCGHIAIARAAREKLRLDRILFAPVGLQPLKQHGSSANFADRVAMTRLAIAADAKFLVTWNDRHLTYLMRQETPEGAEFRGRFPNLTIMDPPTFLAEIRRLATST